LNPAVILLVIRADLIGGSEPGGKPWPLTATQAPTGQADEIGWLQYAGDLV
jgi:hypothetical protein